MTADIKPEAIWRLYSEQVVDQRVERITGLDGDFELMAVSGDEREGIMTDAFVHSCGDFTSVRIRPHNQFSPEQFLGFKVVKSKGDVWFGEIGLFEKIVHIKGSGSSMELALPGVQGSRLSVRNR